jgi:hypothetical protein
MLHNDVFATPGCPPGTDAYIEWGGVIDYQSMGTSIPRSFPGFRTVRTIDRTRLLSVDVQIVPDMCRDFPCFDVQGI